jgi:endo-alpha-1,4-polygalactosaminidase (GH114 family)
MVERLKQSRAHDGAHRKLVIVFIDIGEADYWRWYLNWSQEWSEDDPLPDDWPDHILTHDPYGWESTYPLFYWDERWEDIVIYGRNQYKAAGVPVFNCEHAEDTYVFVTQASKYELYAPAVINTPHTSQIWFR